MVLEARRSGAGRSVSGEDSSCLAEGHLLAVPSHGYEESRWA